MDVELEKVGIYVPTLDRPFFLNRLLRYYAGQHLASPITVGDASTEATTIDQNQKVIERWDSDITIRYIQTPHRTLHESLLDILRAGSEDLAVFVEDDNFVIPNGLYECARFLDHHPEYRIACGWGMTFKPDHPQRITALTSDFYRMGSNEGDDPGGRFTHYFGPGLFLPYLALRRRSEFIEDLLPVEKCPDINFMELLVNGSSVARGRCKKLDTFFIARQVPRPGDYGLPTAADWLRMPRWKDGHKTFVEESEAVLTSLGIDRDSARELVDQALHSYMAARFRSKALPCTTKRMFETIQGFLERTPRIPPRSFAPIQNILLNPQWI